MLRVKPESMTRFWGSSGSRPIATDEQLAVFKKRRRARRAAQPVLRLLIAAVDLARVPPPGDFVLERKRLTRHRGQRAPKEHVVLTVLVTARVVFRNRDRDDVARIGRLPMVQPVMDHELNPADRQQVEKWNGLLFAVAPEDQVGDGDRVWQVRV